MWPMKNNRTQKSEVLIPQERAEGQENLSRVHCSVSCIALVGIFIPNSRPWAGSAVASREAAGIDCA